MNIKPFLLVPGAIALSLSCLSVSPVAAQLGNPAPNAPMQRGMNKLNLTADQQRQMQEIRNWTQTEIGKIIGADNLAKMQALRQSGGKMRGEWKSMNLTEEQRTAIRNVRTEAQRRMQAILTEEQKAMLQQNRQGRQERRQQFRMQQPQQPGQPQ